MDMEQTGSLFDEFMPHGMCYLWRKDILLLNVISDIAIALAYFSIPFFLYFFFKRRPEMPFKGVVMMFSVFIFSCGITHLLGVWTVWHGNYGVQGMGKAVTAIASVVTAFMLIPVMPQLMALRSPLDLEKANDALYVEVVEREKSDTKRQALEMQSRKLEQEIAHYGRINTMGQMAAGLAHELNQPLTAIMQSADAAILEAKSSTTPSSDMIEILSDLEAQAFRAGEIIKALRQFVRKDNDAIESFDLNELADQTINLYITQGDKDKLDIEFIPGEIPLVTGARVQIAQLFVNLVHNARNALLTSDIENKKIILKTMREAKDVIVTIEDNGSGISDDVDVFMPFVGTSEEGLGMGLSICKTIVDMHDGKLWHDTKTDLTTRFGFSLPLIKGQNEN